mmetsp:Transcript_127904/g.292179  ORF Transcript_127904/g.292179 Transcript_127904/m.292179 type:complete len:523 (-) Transcript_127904:2364-3932(-)
MHRHLGVHHVHGHGLPRHGALLAHRRAPCGHAHRRRGWGAWRLHFIWTRVSLLPVLQPLHLLRYPGHQPLQARDDHVHTGCRAFDRQLGAILGLLVERKHTAPRLGQLLQLLYGGAPSADNLPHKALLNDDDLLVFRSGWHGVGVSHMPVKSPGHVISSPAVALVVAHFVAAFPLLVVAFAVALAHIVSPLPRVVAPLAGVVHPLGHVALAVVAPLAVPGLVLSRLLERRDDAGLLVGPAVRPLLHQGHAVDPRGTALHQRGGQRRRRRKAAVPLGHHGLRGHVRRRYAVRPALGLLLPGSAPTVPVGARVAPGLGRLCAGGQRLAVGVIALAAHGPRLVVPLAPTLPGGVVHSLALISPSFAHTTFAIIPALPGPDSLPVLLHLLGRLLLHPRMHRLHPGVHRPRLHVLLVHSGMHLLLLVELRRVHARVHLLLLLLDVELLGMQLLLLQLLLLGVELLLVMQLGLVLHLGCVELGGAWARGHAGRRGEDTGWGGLWSTHQNLPNRCLRLLHRLHVVAAGP